MHAVIDIVLPVFALIAVGFGFNRLAPIGELGLRGFTSYTFNIAFSALLFRAMRNVHLETLDGDILIAYFAAALCVYGLVFVLARILFHLNAAAGAFMALGGCFSNGLGLGVPLTLNAFGEAGMVPLMMIAAVHSLILLTLTTLIVELHRGGAGGGGLYRTLGRSVAAMIRHPVLVSIFAGLVWGRIGWTLPEFAETGLKWLADSAVPCGLIGLGMSLTGIRIGRDLAQTMVMTAAKLLALPVAVYLMARYAVNLDPLWVVIATLYAALPTGANVYLLAQKNETYVARTTSVVLVSTGLSVVTLSVLMALAAG